MNLVLIRISIALLLAAPAVLMAQDMNSVAGGSVAPVNNTSANVTVVSPQPSSYNNYRQPVQNEAMYRQQYESGSSTQLMGRMMSWGGLAASVIGSVSGNPTLNSIGAVVMLVGIPINGAGSGKMVESVNSLNPTLNLEHRGWLPYGFGVGATVVGIYMMFSGVSDYNDSYYGSTSRDNAEQQIVTGMLMTAAGEICMLVGWYKFSASADDAQAGYATVQVSAGPLLVPDVQGPGMAKGMQLTAAF